MFYLKKNINLLHTYTLMVIKIKYLHFHLYIKKIYVSCISIKVIIKSSNRF